MDAVALAGAGSTVERAFTLAELPRLIEAGATEGTVLSARLHFAKFDAHPTVDGQLGGEVVLKCQRCMRPLVIELAEDFRIMLVEEERADEPGGFEPVVADPGRLDLPWLAEDQALLALPLVPLHEPGQCEEAQTADVVAVEKVEASSTQKPFQNLRELMRKR